jgi:acetylornithine deacetylase/succinyl-diaminopimelate desuccinylase-like protein
MDIFPEALKHFQRLLQFNTANPPGNEREAVRYIAGVLKKNGLKPRIIESAPQRANLVVRLKGDGSRRPLLITSHADVVHVEPEKWKYPPFSGKIADGCVWGRGAVDMKNMTAYCLATMLDLARNKVRLKRDVIMSVVADEEVGGEMGMGFMTSKHRDLIDAEYALGEVGGYTLHISGKRIYPIQVAEKGIFWIKIKFHGQPGHGSQPKRNNAHFQLGQFLAALDRSTLPFHRVPTVQVFFDRLSSILGPVEGRPFKRLSTAAGPGILRKLELAGNDPDRFAALAAMLTNTANPTGVTAGRQHNVVPSEVILQLDCRLLPGFTGSEIIAELEKLSGLKLDYEVVTNWPGHESSFDTPLFRTLEKNVLAADPGAHVVPGLTTGFTDAHYLKKIGIPCYGFTPIKMPPDISFPQLFHGHNERIPVEGFRWGVDVFIKTVREFATASNGG